MANSVPEHPLHKKHLLNSLQYHRLQLVLDDHPKHSNRFIQPDSQWKLLAQHMFVLAIFKIHLGINQMLDLLSVSVLLLNLAEQVPPLIYPHQS